MSEDRARPRVLVVEDELMVAMGLELVLADAGYEVVGPLGRLDDALAAARVEEVDFALLDVNLRGAEVYPVADVLSGRGIPFTFLTGYGREALPARHAGGSILSKPFEASKLRATVAASVLAHPH